MKALALLALVLFAAPARADGQESSGDHPLPDRNAYQWTVTTSLYTRHWDPEPDHNNRQRLLGLEVEFDHPWLVGLALFRNSYDQSSLFAYTGRKWDLSDSGRWYAKLMAGLIHGYKEPYEDKIPLNGLGIAPAVIPALGARHRKVVVEAHFGGLAVVMLTGGLVF